MTTLRRRSSSRRLSESMQCAILIIKLSLVAGLVPSFSKVTSNSRKNAATATSTALYAGNYVRVLPRTTRGNRQCFEFQTAVTTMERQGKKIELHAQIHFGVQDYFDYYNSQEFASRVDRIHYELLVDEDLMTNDGKDRRLGESVLMASPSDRKTAQQYGLTCQVDVLDYARPNWIHADLTRQEFIALSGKSNTNPQEPLWALASTAPTWPGAEAVSAFFRPSTPSTPLSTPVAQRLFSNLFLPGSTLATLLRLAFWIMVPSPEMFVMLLDWSSILPRPTGGVSQVTFPVLESLLTGNLQEARQLVFGQVLVSGQRSSNNDDLLIGKRNEHAIEIVQNSLEMNDCNTTALLYGAMHCPDLYQKLLQQGFRSTKTTWRTAWSVRVPKFGTSAKPSGVVENFASVVSPNALGVGLVVVPLYLAIGGLDWIATLQDLEASIRYGDYLDATLEEVLYLIRHVALYLGLAKFVVEWDGGTNLFDVER